MNLTGTSGWVACLSMISVAPLLVMLVQVWVSASPWALSLPRACEMMATPFSRRVRSSY